MKIGERYLRINWCEGSCCIAEIVKIHNENEAYCLWICNSTALYHIGKYKQCSSFATGKCWKLIKNQDKIDILL